MVPVREPDPRDLSARGGVDGVPDQAKDVRQGSPEDAKDHRGEDARQREDQAVLDQPLAGVATSGPNHLGLGYGGRFGEHLHHKVQFVALGR